MERKASRVFRLWEYLCQMSSARHLTHTHANEQPQAPVFFPISAHGVFATAVGAVGWCPSANSQACEGAVLRALLPIDSVPTMQPQAGLLLPESYPHAGEDAEDPLALCSVPGSSARGHEEISLLLQREGRQSLAYPRAPDISAPGLQINIITINPLAKQRGLFLFKDNVKSL